MNEYISETLNIREAEEQEEGEEEEQLVRSSEGEGSLHACSCLYPSTGGVLGCGYKTFSLKQRRERRQEDEVSDESRFSSLSSLYLFSSVVA